jgi:hypothetical protein
MARTFRAILLVAGTLALARTCVADSILAGTNLAATTNDGLTLCVEGDCQEYALQFTLLAPVVIDQVEVAVSGPNEDSASPNGPVFVYLSSGLGSFGGGTLLGDAETTFGAACCEDATSDVLDFTDLNLSLTPGTYYLEVGTVADAYLDYAPPLLTAAGTLGSEFVCANPFEEGTSCGPPDWTESILPGQFAIDIDGSVVPATPEPSSWLLLATGVVSAGLMPAAARKG